MARSTNTSSQIASRGGRVTRARTAVLEILQGANRALSHDEIGTELTTRGIAYDRVTLYRNLEWLVSHELAHRVSGPGRVGRYNATKEERHGHAHFHCDQCNAVFCMESLQPAVAAKLPAGFRLDYAELTLHGRCPKCR